jgi:hypothetical protein
MSAAYSIMLDRQDPGFDVMVNWKLLSRDDGRLEKFAKSLGLRPLGEFDSYSPEEDPDGDRGDGATRAEVV